MSSEGLDPSGGVESGWTPALEGEGLHGREMLTYLGLLLSEKPLAEDPYHGQPARHEPFQKALLLGAVSGAHR